jgi:predicted small secreted protein
MMRAIALLLAVFVLVGCNTVEGIGKDLKQGGEKLEKAATK